jgi:hypothetical protein
VGHIFTETPRCDISITGGHTITFGEGEEGRGKGKGREKGKVGDRGVRD